MIFHEQPSIIGYGKRRPIWYHKLIEVYALVISVSTGSKLVACAMPSHYTVILLIGPLGTNFSDSLVNTRRFSYNNMTLEMSSATWWSFCLGLNVLTAKKSSGKSGLRCSRHNAVVMAWHRYVPGLLQAQWWPRPNHVLDDHDRFFE